jgi:1,4-dihydroxy-2-naphthoyl-CoA hydrolase
MKKRGLGRAGGPAGEFTREGGPRRWGQLADVLKLKVVKVGRGKVLMRMPWSLPASQMAGLLHGGALTTLADTCAAVGTLALLPKGSATVTSELKVNFISNIKSGSALAEASLLHRGKLTMVWEVKVREEKTRKLLAVCTGTFFVFTPKP